MDDLHLYSFALEENTEYFSELHKDASYTPVPSIVYQVQSAEEILGKETTDILNGLEDSEEHLRISDELIATEKPSQSVEVAKKAISSQPDQCGVVSTMSPGRWMENSESSTCLVCGKSFSFFRRRHVYMIIDTKI